MKNGIKPPLPVLQNRHPQARGLILDLPLFERGGSIVRDLARKNRGTLTNFSSLATAWATKTPIGRAIDFAGDNDFINVPYQTIIGSPNKYISVECWFVPDTLSPGFQYLVDRWTYGAGDFRAWSLDLQTSNVVWRTSNGGTDGTSASVSKSITGRTGQLIHAIGTLDSPNNKLRLYVDGVEAANGFGFDGIVASTQQLMIGGGNAGTDGPYDGRIAMVRVWNRLLTASEVADLFADPFALYRLQKPQIAKPAASTSVSVSASILSALFSIPAYAVTAIKNVSIGAGVLSAVFSLPSATATAVQNVSITPIVQSVAFSTQAPTISTVQNVSVAPTAQSATFSLPSATVTAVQDVTTNVAVQGVAITVQTPTFSLGATVSPSALSVVTSVQSPAVKLDYTVSASVQQATFSLAAPTIDTRFDVAIQPAAQSAVFSLLSPTLKYDFTVSPNVLTATFTTQRPTRTGSFYEDKYSQQDSDYSDKYSGRGSSYSDKYSGRSTTYDDKFSNRGSDYEDKHSDRGTDYNDKYPPLNL